MFRTDWINSKRKFAFSGVNKIYNHYLGSKSYKEIENELSEIRTYTRHKERKPVVNFNPFFIYEKHEMWQADICYLPEDNNQNEGFKYLFCLLDVFSRKMFVKMMKRKDKKTVLSAFQEIHEFIKASPQKLYVDKGKEFQNSSFQKYCKDEKINLIFAYNETKAAHVERAQRSFQTILYKILEEKQTKKYITEIQPAIKIYNNRVNRITGFSPNDAYKDGNKHKVLLNLQKYYLSSNKLKKAPKYDIGDFVRISYKPEVFHRGYHPNFTEEVFKIKEVMTNLPQSRYILETFDGVETIKGSFYERDITLANHKEFKIEKILSKRKKGKRIEYFVKWSGYPDTQNSWVTKDQIRNFKNGN